MGSRDVPMSVKRLIAEMDIDGLNVTEFCRQHGISTWSFYAIRRRFQEAGVAGLEPRSRAPRTIANRTPVDVEDLIVVARKELSDDGWDAGPVSIVDRLRAAGVACPSEATVWRILGRRGLITPDPSKAPKHAHTRFVAARPNECWQTDDTGWALADETAVKIINIVDDHSRVCPASRAAPACTTDAVFNTFCVGADEWGWPAGYLADNGSPFGKTFEESMAALGVAYRHSRPYHPQTNGKVERFHQTLKKYLAAQTPADSLAELQAQLDAFRAVYNHHRPHRGINRRIPADVWAATGRSGPADRPLDTPSHLYRSTVHQGRCIAGADMIISLGTRYDNQDTTIIVTGLHCHVFIDGRVIRQLTIDPTRRTQPLHPRTREQ
jgi:transposase InsO family protein